ncbi:uncharacterized protein N7477_009540 [Penicillium maclennaniae]|uniref:uncharacterized protein n=1 Tax=Penicillium maclennaniae TaxID=1343394 RepID=UPI0025415CC0|nr:uncharacterized protein N7477_009540 [Penicillium maclennaniae]KAJ5661924.1 hypothetical protein N7477_009540 [Penicillium maclennaniae]
MKAQNAIVRIIVRTSRYNALQFPFQIDFRLNSTVSWLPGYERNFDFSLMKRLNKMTSTGTVKNTSPSCIDEVQETLSNQFDLQEDKAIAVVYTETTVRPG